MPRETRAGLGPAKTEEDVLRVVEIFAGRTIRALEAAEHARSHRRPVESLGHRARAEAYIQTIAELLGTTVQAVRRALDNHQTPFDKVSA